MRPLILLLLVGLVLGACIGNSMKGPLSLDQAKVDVNVRLPLHNPGSIADYSQITPKYYYFDGDSELRLDTYFTTNAEAGNSIRLARMSTFNVNGQLVIPEEVTGKEVQIVWAQGDSGGKCKILSNDLSHEPLAGDPYQSCLYWFGKDGYRYKLYSVWSEDEAVNFVNALVEAKR